MKFRVTKVKILSFSPVAAPEPFQDLDWKRAYFPSTYIREPCRGRNTCSRTPPCWCNLQEINCFMLLFLYYYLSVLDLFCWNSHCFGQQNWTWQILFVTVILHLAFCVICISMPISHEVWAVSRTLLAETCLCINISSKLTCWKFSNNWNL